ncbi:MAG: helix-hairpin-helix domain-containing protein [Candidatus Hermodarchaeota archaeon]
MTNVFENAQRLDAEELKEKPLKSDLTEDLTIINGIGPSTASKLNKANINTIKQLADITPSELSVISGVSVKAAQKFVSEAKNILPGYDFETFDVAEIFFEEKFLQEESNGKSEAITTSQQENPSISENQSQEHELAIEQIRDQSQEQMENTFNEESDRVEEPIFLEEDSREEYPLVPEIHEMQEIETIPEAFKSSTELDTFELMVEESLKASGYYVIPSSISSLNSIMDNIDYLGCKIVRVSRGINHIIIVPAKLLDVEETVLINESQINSTKTDSRNRIRRCYKNLLKTGDSIFDDILDDNRLREFFQKYLQVNLVLEKSVENKKLFFVSGHTQYKILIEPILVCRTPPRCMEKSILFPYQRSTNLHVVQHSYLSQLLDFIEQKYGFIETRVKSSNAVEDYQKKDHKFRTNVRVISIPIIGFAIALAIIYFTELYFLLRLFNSIGFAIIGIYLTMLAYLYFKFYKAKKQLATEFETPYYLQNLEFSEADLLEFKDMFSTELLTQFGYECFGKEKSFKILDKLEQEDYIKSLHEHKKEDIPYIVHESNKSNEDVLPNENPAYNSKYLSFLED